MTWGIQPSALDSAGHLVSGGGAPASSLLGVNITSATPAGTDNSGQIVVVVAIGGLAANTRICRVTFASPFGVTPRVRLNDETSGVGLAVVNPYALAQSTGVSFDLACDEALVIGTYAFGWTAL
jgi:hypothetical protein